MLKVLIVDDEKYIRDELKCFLNEYDDIEICGESGEGEEAIELAKSLKPDIVFLDIHLHDISGMLVAEKMLEVDTPPYIVFATAYDEYAIQGFQLNAVDYILKPFLEERIKLTIERIRKNIQLIRHNKKSNEVLENKKISLDKLCVKQNNKLILVDTSCIQYIQSINNIIIVNTIDGVYNSNYSLKELEDRLKKIKFIRTHKSYIINLDFIDEIIPWFNYTYKIKVKGIKDCEIPVSRNYMKKFKGILGL
ncbi:MAG: LytTR family DNA-binding domain-containing protein [Maledivibacter sp.]|nr:LytTR family DNA-binding domain-containing protein [Maledivibacter sp.]